MVSSATRLAWGWVDHLREGGTSTWAEWRASGEGDAEPRARFLPGSQQLELLRRLNLAGGTPARLAERVLRASAVGRGIPDLGLVGADHERGFGAPPAEPDALPAAELLRVASGLIAEDLAPRAEEEPPARPPRRRPRRRRRPYRLVGDPWRADPVRRELVRRGRPPGGDHTTVFVLGTDLATMLADAWTARSFAEGGPPWPEFLQSAATARRLPRRADLLHAARIWSERVGRDRVQVVLDADLLPGLIGERGPLPGPPVYAADAVDLVRRVGEALALIVPAARAVLLREVLGPRLAGAPGSPATVPLHHREWVRLQAARIRDGVLEDGYAVHGDPDRLIDQPAPGRDGDPGDQGPDEWGVLTLALRLLLEGDPVGAGRGVR